MSDIQTYLQQILDAVYGEEVRGSIHAAIATMNSDLEEAIQDDLNPLAFKGNLGESGGTNNNLNNLIQTDLRGIWRLKGSTTYTNVPSGFDNSKQGYLIMYAFGESGQAATVAKQEIHYFSDSGANANISWSRVYISGVWQDWHKNVDSTLSIEGAAADAKAVRDIVNESAKNKIMVVGAGTYATDLPDADGVTENSIYRLNFAAGSTSIPSNLPISSWNSSRVATLYTFVANTGSHSGGDYQMFITSEDAWIRNYLSNSWSDWISINHRYPKSMQTIVGAGTYATDLPDADGVTENSIYRLNFAAGSTSIPSNLPISSWNSSNVATLYTYVTNSGLHSAGDYQMFITSENIWTRNYLSNTWGEWKNLGQIRRFPESVQSVINANNYSSLLPSANDVITNSIYRLNFAANTTIFPGGMPFDKWEGTSVAILLTTVTNPGMHSGGDSQVLITTENVWSRNYLSNSWGSWSCTSNRYPKSVQTMIGAGTYAANLSDVNEVVTNSIYRLNFAAGSTSIPANLPITSWNSTNVATLYTFVANSGIHTVGDFQMFITSGNVWTRNYLSNTWGEWICLNGSFNYTVDINGNGDYTSLYECIVEAVKHPNSVIKVKKGTYDLVQELKALKGTDVFDNYDYTLDTIYLTNGIKIVGEPGVLVKAEFESPIDGVANYYSPFDLRFDCTLENLEIHAKNCRYCIHDDQWDRDTHYVHIFKNLKLICDNRSNTVWDRRLAFGGGLGRNGHIEFHNCYFKSMGLDGTAYSGYGSMGYHNSPEQGESDIIVNNCYFADNSTFRITYMGTYSNMTTAFVSGCSLGRAMEITNERYGDSVINVEIVDCNNAIRS